MKQLILLLILCSASAVLCAQILPYHRYTSRDGLIADRVTAIGQDDRGVMWFGSFFGLGSYDGISFKKVRLPFEQQNKFVTSVLPLGKKIYAGFIFSGGLVELSEGKVKSYSLLQVDSTTSNDVIAMGKFDDKSVLIANGKNEIYLFSEGTFTFKYSLEKELGHSEIRVLYRDALNNVWVATVRGLFVIPPSGKKNMLSFFAASEVMSILPCAGGKMWIAVNNAGEGTIYLADGINGNHLVNLTVKAKAVGLRAAGLRGNTEKGFWAVHSQKGLLNVRESGEVKFHPSALNANADLTALFADREHNLWIANDPGLIKISNFSSVSWNFKHPAAAGGYILLDQDGATWVNNSKNLYRIKNDSMTEIEFRRRESGYINKMVRDAQENIWMVRWDEGIWKTRWNDGKLVSKKYFDRYNGVRLVGGAFTIDAEQNLWIAGANGIFRMKNDEVKERYQPVLPTGYHLFINCIIADHSKNILWLGDNAGGVAKVKFRIREGGASDYTIEKIIGRKQGLKDLYIRSMLMDHNGDLWVGTRAGGVYKIHTSTSDEKVEEVSPPFGFTCSRITAIVEEKDSAIWIASCDGIYRFSPSDKQWRHYNVSDGLLSSEVFHLAVDSENQYVWAMTETGVTRIDLRATDQVSVPPLVHITEVNVLGKQDTTALFNPDPQQYKYDHNSIGFVFAGSSFFNEKKITYKYMLEGYDDNWSEPVTTNAVNYASLAPGEYTFKVLAANARGIWSSSPATFKFEIVLPFYRRPWFIFAAIAIVATLLYLFRIDRLQHQYKVEKIRLRIARDLHDDIGSALGSINLMSETAHRRLEKSKSSTEVATMFTRIGHSAQTTLESMDDIIWSINPEKDKVGDLVVRMREFAIPLLEAKEIAFDFKVNAEDYKKLPMNLRKNIFLIFKEAIFNIIKHADCTQVSIRTEIKNNRFCLSVKDNGKGFNLDHHTERNGLRNMKKRSELIGGKLRIDSMRDKGTTLEFQCLIK